ncbi:Endonuclease/exonuclease/phosphatase family protein [Methylococcus capsulatus]|jgi:endonuclease/exonuclease/phosphatase family metal-dependent hydrolase|nr:Endonuclease/exonuclease/phosphatase family protein [Methylococcus capsulatus]
MSMGGALAVRERVGEALPRPANADTAPVVLRLASFNIQTGISTSSYRDYITGGWRHVWPSTKRLPNLNRIAQLLEPFDIAGLQEVDGGGMRSHNIVQTQYLAEHAGFAYWHNQVNRRIGRLALHSNGLLSRIRPDFVHDYPLPGMPGRGALLARFGRDPRNALYVCVAHLALSRRARLKQLRFISDLIGHLPYVVMMGDLNCEPNTPELDLLLDATHLNDPVCRLKTFPSWRPHKMLDHILVTPSLRVNRLEVIDFACSDHLPVSMEVVLPDALAHIGEARQAA